MTDAPPDDLAVDDPVDEEPVVAESPVDEVESHRGLLLAAGLVLWLIVMVPLLVGLAAQHHPRWYPIADLAQTELRVRDVGGRHTPLIGPRRSDRQLLRRRQPPRGRSASGWLAPVYRLLGATSFGPHDLGGVPPRPCRRASALWIAHRRGKVPLMVAVAVALAVVSRFYGPAVFFEPWNPYLPGHVVVRGPARGVVGARRRRRDAAGGGGGRLVLRPGPTCPTSASSGASAGRSW